MLFLQIDLFFNTFFPGIEHNADMELTPRIGHDWGSKFRTPINSFVSERGQISNLSPVGRDRKQIPDAHSFRITTIYFVVVLESLWNYFHLFVPDFSK